MKKQVLVILSFILLIALISLASAEIKLSKETYAPLETLQAEIYGNFIDGLSLENIYFYRERNIPVDYDILKLKDKYLLYALLPYKEGNYTIKIKNTRYETDTGVSSSDIIKEFKIKSTNETLLTINPGFIVAKEDFYIQVKANKNIDITTEFLGEKQNFSLMQNKEKKVYFSISEVKDYTETTIKIKNYEIPVFVFPEETQGIIETAKFRFSPSEISATILKKDSYFFSVDLVNLGRKNITNIKLSSNISDSALNVKITPDSISNLEAGNREFVNLTFSSEKKGNFSGKILAISGNLSTELKFRIEITENSSEVKYTGPVSEEKTCAKIGKICTIKEKCSVPLEFTTDGYCCRGDCVPEEKESSGKWIYGLIIILVVVAGLILLSFYMKKKQRRAIDILKERGDKYQERMSPSKEVRGSLAKT